MLYVAEEEQLKKTRDKHVCEIPITSLLNLQDIYQVSTTKEEQQTTYVVCS